MKEKRETSRGNIVAIVGASIDTQTESIFLTNANIRGDRCPPTTTRESEGMGLLTSGTYYFLGGIMVLMGLATYSFFSMVWQSVAVASCGLVMYAMGFIERRKERADIKKDIKVGKQLNHYNTLIALGYSKENAIKIAENEETVIFPTPKNDKNKPQQD